MAASLRVLVTLTLVLGGFAGMCALQPRRWQEPEDPEVMPSTFVVLETSAESAVILRRIKAKTAVSEKLRANELTLFEAAAWFVHLNSDPAPRADPHWDALPGSDRNEKTCHNVIHWTEAVMSGKASQSEIDAVICRLEQELEQHLAEHGKVLLPGFETD